MRPLIPLLLTACATAGCTRPAEPAGASFSRELAGHVAGAPQTCIQGYPSENLRVIDPATVAYGTGRTIYVNKLAGGCPALSQYNTVIVDARDGTQYCRGNRVRGLEPGAIIPGPWCTLGDWVPYRMP
jgi:hypothetical protein